MSSYDLPSGGQVLTQEQLRATLKYVRLQIISPLSLLVSIGANIFRAKWQNVELEPPIDCPGCPPVDISRAHPTLFTPLSVMISGYWTVVYALQIGFCLMLVLARSAETKDVLMRGVGMRFSIANWLMAGWAVFWTLQTSWSFMVAEVLLILNSLILGTIYLTLHRHYHFSTGTWLFVYTPMKMMLAIVFLLEWLDNGFIVLGWESRDPATYAKYSWQAIGILAGVNVVGLLMVFVTKDLVWTVSAEYLLVSLLLKKPKPFTMVVTLFIFLALYPFTYLASIFFHSARTREGRIRLEEEAVAASHEAVAPPATARAHAGTVPPAAPVASGTEGV
ncbi:hypothetical protein [Phaffia rhodozyma]|uniref:Uncharacterized protein n=1 Tax=Phaffia rhodozyma TaxID=264483 RepID=A0A0F7SVY9_PHARH|nr:hypothetical protein [Phaffia rhodozyma]